MTSDEELEEQVEKETSSGSQKENSSEEVSSEKDEEISEEEEREKLEQEVEELEKSLKNVMADFDNYRKRMMREKKNIIERATEDLMIDLLEILDDFERAIENEDEMESEGVNMIYKKFKKALQKHGLEEIDAENEKFDPKYHECLMSVEDEDHEEDEIIEEFQKGYKLNDKVIRPSKVKVAK